MEHAKKMIHRKVFFLSEQELKPVTQALNPKPVGGDRNDVPSVWLSGSGFKGLPLPGVRGLRFKRSLRG